MTDPVEGERRRVGEELIAQAEKLEASHGRNPAYSQAILILRREGARIRDGLRPLHPTSSYMPAGLKLVTPSPESVEWAERKLRELGPNFDFSTYTTASIEDEE